jgi:DNA-binding transcriptional ArsR family regulator
MGEQALLSILQHPLRRELLKLYVEAGEVRSPKELTLSTNRHISNVGYHVRVLAEKGAIELITVEPRRGSIEHFYKATSLIDEVPWGELPSDSRRSTGAKRPLQSLRTALPARDRTIHPVRRNQHERENAAEKTHPQIGKRLVQIEE